MVVSTQAIVIRSIKFSDTSLIVKLYTQKEGIKSYLLKGILTSKSKVKAAFFQPLNLLEIEAKHNTKGTLNSISEVRMYHHYQTIPADITKQTILLFLAEVLNFTLQEEEPNETLFEYLKTAFIWLDTHDKSVNFHLLFLLNLTKYLGFYPDTKLINAPYFNLADGKFSTHPIIGEILKNEDLELFKSLLFANFDYDEKLKLTAQKRQQLLTILMQYYELHISGFKKPKSLAILKAIFE